MSTEPEVKNLKLILHKPLAHLAPFCWARLFSSACCLVSFWGIWGGIYLANVDMAAGQPPIIATASPDSAGASGGTKANEDNRKPVDFESLIETQREIKEFLPKVLPCVVAIDGGSGVVVNRDGLILTASHVAGRAGGTIQVTFSDGRVVQATTLGTHKATDAAALQINSPGPWPHLKLAKNPNLELGDWCLALGYPSSYPRNTPANLRIGRILKIDDRELMTDCLLMGGDSGGPLINLEGEIIGINSRVKNRIDENFHIPASVFINEWKNIVAANDTQEQFSPSGERAYLGLNAETDSQRIRIRKIHANSPAEFAGLLPEDVILQFDGKRVVDFDQVLRALDERQPGEEVKLIVNRYGRLLNIYLVLGQTRQTIRGERTDRPQPGWGRDATELKQALRPKTEQWRETVVTIVRAHRAATLGTIVTPDGLIIAKMSELEQPMTCVLADGRRFAGTLVASDRQRDLALIKVEAEPLTSIQLPAQPSRPTQGDVLISVGRDGEVIGVGVVSTSLNRLPLQLDPSLNRVRMGISVHPTVESRTISVAGKYLQKLGLRVRQVEPRSVGEAANLFANDLICAVDGQPISNLDSWKAAIENLTAGELKQFEIIRNDKLMVRKAETKTDSQRTIHDLWGGGPFSERRFDLSPVIIHDSKISPENCGGPVFDLDGTFVGINIARSLRVASFAISSQELQSWIQAVQPSANLIQSR